MKKLKKKNQIVEIFNFLLIFIFWPVATAAEEQADGWDKMLRATVSLTDVSSSRTDEYSEVAGVSGVESQTSWQTGLNGRFRRNYPTWNHEHRILMKYGKIDREVSDDEIDAISIGRYNLTDDVFTYASGRVRSEFDTFGHPTTLDASGGLGIYLFDSEKYGEMEIRFGPRGNRKWNPSENWEGYKEFIAEYMKRFEGGRFNSTLESYTPTDDSDQYTVRWENKLLASLNSWLDIEYSFLLYYEDEVGEVATKNVSHLNLVYNFWP